MLEEKGVGEANNISVYESALSTVVPMRGGVHTARDCDKKETVQKFFHKPTEVVVATLQRFNLKMLVVKHREVVECTCVQLMLSYCFVIFEGEEMITIPHGVALKRS